MRCNILACVYLPSQGRLRHDRGQPMAAAPSAPAAWLRSYPDSGARSGGIGRPRRCLPATPQLRARLGREGGPGFSQKVLCLVGEHVFASEAKHGSSKVVALVQLSRMGLRSERGCVDALARRECSSAQHAPVAFGRLRGVCVQRRPLREHGVCTPQGQPAPRQRWFREDCVVSPACHRTCGRGSRCTRARRWRGAASADHGGAAVAVMGYCRVG